MALDAKTGREIPAFGDNGVVDLKVGVVYGRGTQIDLVEGQAAIHATPTIARDYVIVGATFDEGQAVPTHDNAKGIVRAYDVRTGELRWSFNTIPRAGEFGNDTWLNESWAVNGNVGVWTQITADEELGLVYVPVETPTSDLYGGHRPGENLFAESIVCLDLETGERRWHFQIVHHPIWNMDLPGAPLLADLTVDGREVKAVAVPIEAVAAVHLRPRNRRARLPDRGAARAARRRPGRVVFADATYPDQAAAVRPQRDQDPG